MQHDNDKNMSTCTSTILGLNHVINNRVRQENKKDKERWRKITGHNQEHIYTYDTNFIIKMTQAEQKKNLWIYKSVENRWHSLSVPTS